MKHYPEYKSSRKKDTNFRGIPIFRNIWDNIIPTLCNDHLSIIRVDKLDDLDDDPDNDTISKEKCNH